MEKELVELLKSFSGDSAAVLKTYIIWYYAYWTCVNFTIGGIIGGAVYGAYRLTKRWQDYEFRP